MTEILFSALILAGFAAFSAKRLLTYLHLYQQEEYDRRLFLRRIAENRIIDKRLSLGIVVLFVIITIFTTALSWTWTGWVWTVLLAALFVGFAVREADPRRRSKKKLAMTARARRIFLTALFVAILPAIALSLLPADSLPGGALWWLVPVQFIPLALVMADLALTPFERRIQNRFWQEAHDKVLALNPVTVGITGSFGKTSVKHILGHILSSAAPTLVTPGSVNTPMGISRIIREQLSERHKYFVVEMGAYGPGSIARLCRLTPPDYGAVTAIGHAHYERFKSLETVARAKYELAEAVAEKSGQMIVHADTLAFPFPGALHKEKPGMFTVVGETPEAALQMLGTHQREHGLDVDILWQGESYTLSAPLYGLHHGINMAVAFAIARTLGLPEKHILTALKTTPQIAHRLEVKPNGGGLLIDDAYNSNPAGFRAALDLLTFLAGNRRRVLITPGMIELGSAHDELHGELGRYAAGHCDIALIVRPERIRSFAEAFQDAKNDQQTIVEADSFSQAWQWLSDNGREDDVILIENDLPDIYESLPVL